MDGDELMEPQELHPQGLAEYLARLLGRPIEIDTLVKLSSGQQARVAAWLAERGFTGERTRESLSSPFRPAALLGDEGGTPKAPAPAIVAGTKAATYGAPSDPRIGIDIQRIDELFAPSDAFDPKASTELKAIFTPREISYAQSRAEPFDTLAGLFAAKEALRKCHPSLLSRALPELEVLPDMAGRPEFPGFSVSISHSGGFAIAVAAAMERPEPLPLPTAPAPAAVPAVLPEGSRSAGRGGRATAIAIAAALTLVLVVLGELGTFHALCSCR
jgi:phosphopantetheine--protein transferase-like protein